MPPRTPLLALVASVALLAAGCGTERGEPDLGRITPPGNFAVTAFNGKDVSAAIPQEWQLAGFAPPRVFTVSASSASLTLWAYEARAKVTDAAGAEQAGQRIVAELSAGEMFELLSLAATEVDGSPAVEIIGLERVGSRSVRVRSVHVFAGRTEYVVDAFADAASFKRSDLDVFSVVIDSLRLGGKSGALDPSATDA